MPTVPIGSISTMGPASTTSFLFTLDSGLSICLTMWVLPALYWGRLWGSQAWKSHPWGSSSSCGASCCASTAGSPGTHAREWRTSCEASCHQMLPVEQLYVTLDWFPPRELISILNNLHFSSDMVIVHYFNNRFSNLLKISHKFPESTILEMELWICLWSCHHSHFLDPPIKCS